MTVVIRRRSCIAPTCIDKTSSMGVTCSRVRGKSWLIHMLALICSKATEKAHVQKKTRGEKMNRTKEHSRRRYTDNVTHMYSQKKIYNSQLAAI